MSVKCRLDIKKDIIDSVITNLETKNIKKVSNNEVFVPVRTFGTLETTYNIAKNISDNQNKKYNEEITFIEKHSDGYSVIVNPSEEIIDKYYEAYQKKWFYDEELNSRIDRFGDNSKMYQLSNQSFIKPGVEELFNSNPELANKIYETLGFQDNMAIPDYEVVTRPSKDIGKSKGRSGNFVEITTPDNYRTNMSAYMVQTNNEGKLFITDIEKYNEDSTFKGFGTAAYVDFFENYKNQGISTDNKLTKDGIKLLERLEKIGLVYKTDAKLIDDTQVSKVFDTKIYEYDKPLYEFNLNWKNNQITSQQKQQALQLYSQYLSNFVSTNFDSIISDLQSKNLLEKKCS